MTPAAVTDSLLHALVTSSRAEGTGRLAVAAAITLDDRVLLCGHTTQDFDQEWDLPSGLALPGETLASALDRILACGYGLDIVEIPRYLGSHDRMHDGETTRTFVFTATCADPHQICQHAQIAHCWADPASLPDQISQDLARLAGLAAHATGGTTPSASGQWQLTTALRACSKGIYCGEAATELIINHRTWLRRDDFTRQFILSHAATADDITAAIDWETAITALDAGNLPCSGSEAAMLRLAASLATGTPISLNQAITSLDHANLNLIINAVRHAGGRK
jgi:ADP-ribose pyrophosphatase YjhB (NUDIX family)